jgi:glycosyltransferase involved in cell wall biosynthesis
LNILTVSHFFESHGGGIERVAGWLVRQFAAAGHGAAWAASDCDAAPAADGFTAVELACANPTERLTGLPMPLPSPTGLRRLRAAVDACDVVILHDALYATSLAAFVLARRADKPTIVIQHIAAIPFRSRFLRSMIKLANELVTAPVLRVADQVVFISDSVRRDLAHLPLRRPARLLFNGVDSALFRPGAAQREEFGLPRAGRIAVFAGRFVEKKGLSVLEAVARARPDVTFALAGSGPIDPRGWNLGNVYCLGTLSPDRMAALYRCGDVLLLPSVGEGYPLVIQEAMACGLPVICAFDSACADPAAAEFLTGVEVDLTRPERTAAAIAPLLDSQHDLTKRSRMADHAARTYSWPAMADALADIAEALRR